MSDVFETMLARLDEGLQVELLRSREQVAANMQLAELALADGWSIGFRTIIAQDPEARAKPGGERYYFVPVRSEGGEVVESRADLSVTVVVC